MAPFSSLPVNTAKVSAYFSSFPVRTCEAEALPTIQKALKHTITTCTLPGTRERKRAQYRHANPAGDLFGLCLTLCEADRVGYVAQLTEFLCIVDDVMEELPFEEAITEHAILRQALYEEHDEDDCEGQVVGRMKSFLRQIRQELVSQNDPSNLLLLQTLDTSLHNRDSVDSEFQTLEDYIPYRKTNFDFEFVCQLLRWAMKIPLNLDPRDEGLAKKYEHIIGVIVGLTNDYFSWEMEAQQTSDRIRNAVPVLMIEHSVSEAQAKSILKEVILNEEQRATELKSSIENAMDIGGHLKSYVAMLELFAAGYSYWCATCPRYHRPQKEEDLVDQDARH